MNRNIVLHHGTQMRDCILGLYRNYPRQDANEIVRRLVFEIGETVSDLHGRKDAGLMLYAAADACTAKLPIEDYRLPTAAVPVTVAPEAPAAPPVKPWASLTWSEKAGRVIGRIAGALLDRFVVGLFLGLSVRWHS